MMTPGLGLAATGVEAILELSADAQIKRRAVPRNSPAFHNLTGAIAAYGKVLALLAALERREEFFATVGVLNLPERTAA